MRPPDKKKPGEPENRNNRAENTEARHLNPDSITNVVAFSRAGWKIAMRRAYAIRRYEGRAKDHAVHLWRVAVVDAIGCEVRG